MQGFRLIAAFGLIAGLAACSGADLASRNQPQNATELSFGTSSEPRRIVLTPQYKVTEVNITVPQSLRVSEDNLYYPIADIVWRGDPRGNRYSQIQAIFTEAFGLGTGQMQNGPEVIVEAEVTRFHSLTEKTRYSIGGMHSLRFNLTVRRAATGEVIDGPRLVVADIAAAGGKRAIAEDIAGRTQRVVIIDQLSKVIRRELSQQSEDPGAVLTSRGNAQPSLAPVLTPAHLMQQSPVPL